MPADETPSPRTEKLEGGRRYRTARLRAAVDEDPRAVAAAGSPARVVAVVERSEGEGKRSAEGKAKGRQRSASGVWVLAPGVRGTWRERMGGGAAEDEASRARIKTGPFLSLALKPSPRVLSVCYKKRKRAHE